MSPLLPEELCVVGDIIKRDFRVVYTRSVYGNRRWVASGEIGGTQSIWYALYFLTLFFIVGITPILTGMTLDYVSILGNTFGAIFGLFPVVALFNLNARNQNAYEKAPFKIPVMGNENIADIGVLIYGFGIYKSWDFIGVKGMASFAIYSALMIAYAFWREPVVRAKIGSVQGVQTR